MITEQGTTVFGTVSLGTFINWLKAMPSYLAVKYDFEYMIPELRTYSYRGYHDHVAFGYSPVFLDGEPPKSIKSAGDIVDFLERKLGTTFEMYKGGTGRFTEEVPLWVANSGECTDRAIVGIEWKDDIITIMTTIIS